MEQAQLCGDDFDHLALLTSETMMAGQFDQFIYCLTRFTGAREVVELGVWKGQTAAFLAKAMKHNGGMCYGVDVGEYQTEAMAHIERLQLSRWFTYIRGDSAEVGRTWKRGRVNFVFVDAGHDYDHVRADVEAWWPHLRVGGYMAIHDIVSRDGAGRVASEITTGKAPFDTWQCLVLPLYWEHGALVVTKLGESHRE